MGESMEKEEDEEAAMAERAVTSTASSLGMGKARSVNLILPQVLEQWEIPFLCQEAPLIRRQKSNEL